MEKEDLKKWRKDHGLTFKKLSVILGVDISTVLRWERGLRKIPPFLHLALNWLSLTLKDKDK